MPTSTPHPDGPGPEPEQGPETGHYTQVLSQLDAAGRDITELLEVLTDGLTTDRAANRATDMALPPADDVPSREAHRPWAPR